MLKFKWEESTSSLLTLFSSWWYGDSTNFDVQINKVRVRVGETQKKYVPTSLARYNEPKKLSDT